MNKRTGASLGHRWRWAAPVAVVLLLAVRNRLGTLPYGLLLFALIVAQLWPMLFGRLRDPRDETAHADGEPSTNHVARE